MKEQDQGTRGLRDQGLGTIPPKLLRFSVFRGHRGDFREG